MLDIQNFTSPLAFLLNNRRNFQIGVISEIDKLIEQLKQAEGLLMFTKYLEFSTRINNSFLNLGIFFKLRQIVSMYDLELWTNIPRNCRQVVCSKFPQNKFFFSFFQKRIFYLSWLTETVQSIIWKFGINFIIFL